MRALIVNGAKIAVTGEGLNAAHVGAAGSTVITRALW